MSIKVGKEEKLNVHLRGEIADKFKRIKTLMGLENDTEVIRALITWYYNQHEAELTGPPKSMWHLNLNDNGVLIWDPSLHEAVQINFNRKGISCLHCKKDNCRHIQFAIAKPDVQTVIRKKKKEGWQLPDL